MGVIFPDPHLLTLKEDELRSALKESEESMRSILDKYLQTAGPEDRIPGSFDEESVRHVLILDELVYRGHERGTPIPRGS
ncbi:hypothetical protein EEB12_21025 [Rhodococcus sp. WS1]|nr:hypothetical protein EEB12_21025 [Rhodococcus sp. WS1]